MDKNPARKIETKRPDGRQRSVWKPKPVTANDGVKSCPHCGEPIKASYAVCPHCGRSLTADKCSFCGAPMKPNAKFCTRCGQSREGVECPRCGTLNARNFCRKCNAPLTPAALTAVAEAKDDPRFRALQARADELAELHERIEQLRSAPAGHQPAVQLSKADQALLDEYAEILGAIGAVKPTVGERTPEPDNGRRRYEEKAANLDAILDAYREKAREMNAALAALTPPPDFTPEQQRDYYSARKIAAVEHQYDLSGYTPAQWKCNYCGCLHDNPSECAEPQLGGTWIYTTVEQYIDQHKSGIIVNSTLKIG